MKYGIMKSSFMSNARALKLDPSLLDFAENVDAGLMFLSGVLPLEVVPNLSKVYTVDVSPDVDNRTVPLPGSMLKLESASLAKTRTLVGGLPIGAPVYIPATIVSQRKFLEMSMYSDEPVVSVFNGMINFNPALAQAQAGQQGAVRAVYRAIPESYLSGKKGYSKGSAISAVVQDLSNQRLFNLGAGVTFISLGLDIGNMNGGRLVFMSGMNLVTYEIDYAWDGINGLSGVHIKESSFVFSENGVPIASAFIGEAESDRLTNTNMIFADMKEPGLPNTFHHLILDYANGRYLSTRQPQISASIMNSVMQTLKPLGVSMKIEFGGEE